MHRQSILNTLEQYLRRHPDEANTANRIKRLVEQHEDCFDRTCLPGHITGSAWIISHDFSRCLLTHHRKLNKWLQLGGHADGQPDPHLVALREAEEESGMTGFRFFEKDVYPLPLDIDVHIIPARADEPAHEHHDFRYLLIAPGNQDLQISDESHDLRWFTDDQLLRITNEESLLRMWRKAEAIIR